MLEVVILLMAYLIICLSPFKSKRVQHDYRNKWIENMYDANTNINLMVECVIQIKSGIMINADVSVKNIIYVKKIIFAILIHVVAKMVNI